MKYGFFLSASPPVTVRAESMTARRLPSPLSVERTPQFRAFISLSTITMEVLSPMMLVPRALPVMPSTQGGATM